MRTSASPRRPRRPSTAADYVDRVNRAIDYVASRLDRPVRLQDVARAAAFSPHHFHRVFRAVVGETLAEFAQRLRLDRALMKMAYDRRSPIARVAASSGFASASDFSRAFKRRFGAAPRAFDLAAWRREHEARMLEAIPPESRPPRVGALPPAANPDGFKVRIRDLPARTVAYLRVADPFRPGVALAAYRKLMRWADEHGVRNGTWLGYLREKPQLVPLEKCALYVAVTTEGNVPRGEVGRIRLPDMTVAEVEVRGGTDVELRAFDWLFEAWLPRSGYVPDDHPRFGEWIGAPYANGETYFEIKVQLPVRR